MMKTYLMLMESSKIDFLIFGHIGESHLHANILPSTQEQFYKSKDIYMKFVEKAISLGGTVSAEHGIGKTKHSFLEKMITNQGIKEIANLKKH